MYEYPGQTQPFLNFDPGTVFYPRGSAQPSAILRLLEDGKSQQTTQMESNNFGRITKYTDTLGRQTQYLYDSNQIDLLKVVNANTAETLAQVSYNTQHLPTSSVDASGQTTTYTYNAAGQILTLTDAKSQTSVFAYDPNGYLTSITGPYPGATTTFTYDSFGRVGTGTSSDGYTLAYEYDALDRLTKVTYPDGTFSQTTYDKLDPVASTDRQGRVTATAYDSLRRPVSITDPLGQTTKLSWCGCGALASMTDPKGNTTNWNRDVQGRVTSKVFADGSVIQYSYDAITGRLANVTDAKGQVTTNQYFPDGNLRQTTYSGGSTSTAPVTFAYDPNTNRVTSFTDGTGTTRYKYFPASTLGALQVASVTGPRGDETDYGFDELGRVVSRTIDGVPVNLSYDSLGRIVNETNLLGSFGYSYVDATRRLQSVTYPNGQSSQYSYFDNTGDNRLSTILHQDPSQNLLSQFDHTFAATGEITSVTRQAPELSSSPNAYQFNYDSSSQLTAAALTSSDGTALASYSYKYDAAGNRSLDQSITFNNLNQVSSFRYDKNGNLLSDGPRTYEWDAADRLTAIISGAHRSEFAYDGLDRRVRIIEKDNGTVVNDKQLLWCGTEICEERSIVGASTAVTRRFFGGGETQIAGGVESPYYYTRDHLGSIRQMTDGSGAVVASYDYDPWGRPTKLAGSIDAAFGYAGYYVHGPSGLDLTHYRAYDPNLGRWLNRDPIAEDGGLNLYAYVTNNPVNGNDPLGLGQFLVDYGYVGNKDSFAIGKYVPLGHVSYVTDSGRKYQMTIQGLQIYDTGVPPTQQLKGLPVPLLGSNISSSSLIDPAIYDDKVIEQIYRELKPQLEGKYGLENNCISVAQRVRGLYYKRTGKTDPLAPRAPRQPTPEQLYRGYRPGDEGLGGIIF